MKTKVIILGEAEAVKPELKKIELIKYLGADLWVTDAEVCPSEWYNIELIVKNYYQGFDLMFAYNNIRESGVLYIGHFNDGVV